MSKKQTNGGPLTSPIKVLTVVEPRALLIQEGLQGVVTYGDDRVRGLFGRKERIAIHAPAGFDMDEFEIVKQHLMGPQTRKKYDVMGVDQFPRNLILCTAVVWSMRWMHEDSKGGCLCDPRGRFGVVLVDVEAVMPRVYCEREATNGEVWNWKPGAEGGDGQTWLF